MKPYYYFVHYSAVNHIGEHVIGQQVIQRKDPISTPEDFNNFRDFVIESALKSNPSLRSNIIIVNFILLHRDEQNEAAN